MANDLKVRNRSGSTLPVSWSVEQNPYAHKPRKLTVLLSQTELVRLIETVPQMALFIADAIVAQIIEKTASEAEPLEPPKLPCIELLGATIQIP